MSRAAHIDNGDNSKRSHGGRKDRSQFVLQALDGPARIADGPPAGWQNWQRHGTSPGSAPLTAVYQFVVPYATRESIARALGMGWCL